MRREIKFRGKCVTSGQWLYGSLVTNITTGTAMICNDFTMLTVVDPETVGQFTGLKDKNGVDVFEGDIIRAIAILSDSNGYDSNFKVSGTVRYDLEHSSFTFSEKVKHPVENYVSFIWQLDEDTIEVIGSIHG